MRTDKPIGTDPRSDTDALAGGLHVKLPHQHQLVDDAAGLLITGCDPGAAVALTASADVDGARFQSAATFEADSTGRVDTSRDPSLAGTYTGIDPFGLWWSGNPVARSAAASPTPISCRVHVESGKQSGDFDFDRHWLADGVTSTDVRQAGVYGMYVRPGGPGPFPAVVAFAGSGGGLGAAAAWAPILASRGFATLAIAYFGVADLPSQLVRIEVEVVERAIAWLNRQTEVAPQPLALMGMSRGSELASWPLDFSTASGPWSLSRRVESLGAALIPVGH